MSAPLRVGLLAALTTAIAACSLVVDLDGFSGGTPGPADADADARAAVDARSSSGSSGATSGDVPDSGGSEGGPSAETGAPGCASFTLSITGCTQKATFFPANGTGTTTGRAEVIVLTQYQPAGDVTTVTDNRTAPHVLVLGSYSATKWKVVAKAPAAVVKVVLAGYELSSLDGAMTENDAEGPYAYAYPSSHADELFAYANAKTGSDPSGAAMCYGTKGFVVDDACP